MSRDASQDPTPYAVICRGDPEVGFHGHGRVFLNELQYMQQMNNPWAAWRCPQCGLEAEWDSTCQADSWPDKEEFDQA